MEIDNSSRAAQDPAFNEFLSGILREGSFKGSFEGSFRAILGGVPLGICGWLPLRNMGTGSKSPNQSS